MPGDKGEIKTTQMTEVGCQRRRFLELTAFAAAGTAAATVLPTTGSARMPATTKAPPVSCPNIVLPMKDVEGKVAFITGGDSGIGLGIARAFADAGMKVVITYRNKSHLDEAMKLLASANDRVHAIDVDVTDRPGMENAAAEAVNVFGKVHVLVNNAGVVLPPTLSETNYQDWDWVLNINLNGPFNGVHVFMPLIRSHGEGGQIITTSSVMGLFALGPGSAAYTVSKYAVIGMMEVLRAELAGTNIGASVFCPGLVTSHIMETSLRNRPAGSAGKDDEEALKDDTRYRNDPRFALDPLDVGQMVLRGMRNNDLYILTSPEFEKRIRDRGEALLSAIPRDHTPPPAMAEAMRSDVSPTIYTVERDRHVCGRAGNAKHS
jgi:NAD(P)-dependent dehydrogenase (short-subunit alcohol dehydrogenase family)